MKHIVIMSALGATIFALQGAGFVVIVGWVTFVMLVGMVLGIA